jgi:hypothetical protein
MHCMTRLMWGLEDISPVAPTGGGGLKDTGLDNVGVGS